MKKATKIIIAIIVVIVLVGIIIFVATHSGKKVIDMAKFEEMIQKEGYEIAGVLGNNNGNEAITEIKAAIDSQYTTLITFYILKDDESAKTLYTASKNTFEQAKSEGDILAEKEQKNYAIYSLKSNEKYMYVERVDNTVIEISTNTENEEKITNFIKKLGY